MTLPELWIINLPLTECIVSQVLWGIRYYQNTHLTVLSTVYSLSQLHFSTRPSAVWRERTTCLLLTGKCCTTWVWSTWPCSSMPLLSTSLAQPSTWTHVWGTSTCCSQVKYMLLTTNWTWWMWMQSFACWAVIDSSPVSKFTPQCSVLTVALTNLEDVENATRAYEQAVTMDEWVCLTPFT